MFTKTFLDQSVEILRQVSIDQIDGVVDVLRVTRERGGRVFFCGSGGGAGHASHATCDFRKLAGIECYSVTDNVSELTARTNDEGWDTSYSAWLATSRLNDKDTLFVFSVGGGDVERGISVNLVNAVLHAKEVGAAVTGIVGRDGGSVAALGDVCVLIPEVDPATVTPQTEGMQALMWHLIVSHPDLAVGRGEVGVDGLRRQSNWVARPERVSQLSVVMAVYNEVHTVGEVIDQVLKVDLGGRLLELVIVESNSTDGTRDIIEAYETHPNVRVIYEERPLGKGHAVRAGLAAAVGDVVLIQDGDLEYSVNDYVALLEPIERGDASFVLGSRHVRGRPMRHFADSRRTGLMLNAAHWIFTGLFDATYWVRLRDPFTMYKVFRRECIDGLSFSSNRFDFDWELVAKLIRRGHVPLEVPVTYDSRDFASGKKVRLFRDPVTWVAACAKFRVVPVAPQPRPASLPEGVAHP